MPFLLKKKNCVHIFNFQNVKKEKKKKKKKRYSFRRIDRISIKDIYFYILFMDFMLKMLLFNK